VRAENRYLKNSIKMRLFKVFDRLSGLLPYLGLVLVGLLMLQTRTASQIAENTLRESVQNQESLRNTLWANLLIQRMTVLSQSSVLKADPDLQEKARDIARSIPSFFPPQEQRSLEQNLVLENLKRLDDLEALLDVSAKKNALSKTDPIIRLGDQVEILGTSLNASESKDWYSLKEHNQEQLEDLKKRQRDTYATYLIFSFYLVILVWISRRKKRAELFLKQSERKMRTLAEASFESIIFVQNDLITEVNPAFETMFGVKAFQAMSKPLSNYVILPDQLQVDSIKTVEAIGLRDGGESLAIEVSVKSSVVEDQPIKIVAIRDLSDKKQSENLRFEKEAAERANRSKSIFLANVSHELRTPMHGVLSFARFGVRDARDHGDKNFESHFQEIFESGTRLMELLDDLLDLAKLEAGKMSYAMEARDFAPVCEQLLAEQEAFALEKKITFNFTLPREKELVVIMDTTRISQVVRNIISNAIKFSNEGTEISVTAKLVSRDLICEILNTGRGIPAAELESVFDKFVQSSRTRSGAGGTGLGLAICKEIIEQHHGKIWAESESNGRTKFIFKIPIEQPQVKMLPMDKVA